MLVGCVDGTAARPRDPRRAPRPGDRRHPRVDPRRRARLPPRRRLRQPLDPRASPTAAEVPLSQIHYHFGSKQQLILAVLEAENERLLERQRTMFDGPEPLWRQWERACDFLDEDLESGYVRILQEMIAAGWSDAGGRGGGPRATWRLVPAPRRGRPTRGAPARRPRAVHAGEVAALMGAAVPRRRGADPARRAGGRPADPLGAAQGRRCIRDARGSRRRTPTGGRCDDRPDSRASRVIRDGAGRRASSRAPATRTSTGVRRARRRPGRLRGATAPASRRSCSCPPWSIVHSRHWKAADPRPRPAPPGGRVRRPRQRPLRPADRPGGRMPRERCREPRRRDGRRRRAERAVLVGLSIGAGPMVAPRAPSTRSASCGLVFIGPGVRRFGEPSVRARSASFEEPLDGDDGWDK